MLRLFVATLSCLKTPNQALISGLMLDNCKKQGGGKMQMLSLPYILFISQDCVQKDAQYAQHAQGRTTKEEQPVSRPNTSIMSAASAPGTP